MFRESVKLHYSAGYMPASNFFVQQGKVPYSSTYLVSASTVLIALQDWAMSRFLLGISAVDTSMPRSLLPKFSSTSGSSANSHLSQRIDALCVSHTRRGLYNIINCHIPLMIVPGS